MSKTIVHFFCNNCGYESVKWLGKCPACNQWNTFIEEVVTKENHKDLSWEINGERKQATAIALNKITYKEEPRIVTADIELNRVLGGGIVKGSVILVAGEPGIGKSTLFLQTGFMLTNVCTLYISGEESEHQIQMRAQRLQRTNQSFYLLTDTSTQIIFKEIKKLQPQLVIVDSVQTLQSQYTDAPAGSIAQIKQCASEFIRFAKATNIAVILIGHITKEGAIAGPKILEHMVDTVLQFEGDRHYAYRLLRTLKNRFGNTLELGIYEMSISGMHGVHNPSEILISQKNSKLSGSAIASSIEGVRALLIEVQALVTQSVYGTPQRTVSGFDSRRLQLLLAVLEKRGGFHFGMKDVFVNIAGGIKIEDPSVDLAVIAALLSSYEDVALPPKICFTGEVGLNGEIRAVSRIEQRIMEAEKMGLEKIVISKYNKGFNASQYNIEIIMLEQTEELYRYLFN